MVIEIVVYLRRCVSLTIINSLFLIKQIRRDPLPVPILKETLVGLKCL